MQKYQITKKCNPQESFPEATSGVAPFGVVAARFLRCCKLLLKALLER